VGEPGDLCLGDVVDAELVRQPAEGALHIEVIGVEEGVVVEVRDDELLCDAVVGLAWLQSKRWVR
jgi:hypothetical protein